MHQSALLSPWRQMMTAVWIRQTTWPIWTSKRIWTVPRIVTNEENNHEKIISMMHLTEEEFDEDATTPDEWITACSVGCHMNCSHCPHNGKATCYAADLSDARDMAAEMVNDNNKETK